MRARGAPSGAASTIDWNPEVSARPVAARPDLPSTRKRASHRAADDVGPDRTDREWIDRVLSRFANEVSPATGARFLDLLVEFVASGLGFDAVVIGEAADADGCVRTLAAYPAGMTPRDVGAMAQLIAVPLIGSDGREVGFLSAHGHKTPANRARADVMLRIVAGRAAAEIERESIRRRLEQSEALARGLMAQRRGVEDRLRQLQRTEIIGRLAAGIAHDFGNILMVIRSHADIMALRTPALDARHSYVEAIRDAVTRGAGLARQLLAFNRHREFELSRFDLNASIEQMTTLLRRLLGSGIHLVTNLAPEARFIIADATQIEQIVLNLTINARDAMPNGGRIVFETCLVSGPGLPAAVAQAPDDYVCFSVADTGCGISSDIKDRIFDPLFTTKAEGCGTGIGLSTVHDIVTRHGGVVDVAGAEGSGATFRVFLRRDQPARRKVRATASSAKVA